MTKLITGKLNVAYHFLNSCNKKDHIIYNYMGEILALSGDLKEAKDCFLKSITLKLDYIEPIDNLKALGGIKQFHLIDPTWTKFK
jgi:hypothetical protein